MAKPLFTRFASTLKRLSDSPGIYLFFNSNKELIYVGKAASLRARVRSYFQGPRLRRPIESLIYQVASIKWKVTDSALEAVILEANYIKKFQPKYNVIGKDDKSWNYLALTREPFPKFISARQHELERQSKQSKQNKRFKYVFGPYPGLNTKAALKILRRLFKFSTCAPRAKRPCLYYQMGQCLGVCAGEISPKEYRQKVIRPLAMFLRGNKKGVIKMFEKEMKQASRQEDFEAAARLRDQLRQLQRVQDVALLNESFIDVTKYERYESTKREWRIEGYDISSLGATEKVGSMVVFDESGPVKFEYRKFIIRTVSGASDVDCLKEVLGRRLQHTSFTSARATATPPNLPLERGGSEHNAWPLPDIILVDGGRPQINAARAALQEAGLTISIVGIAKGPKRQKNDIILGSRQPEFIHWVAAHQKLLIQVRDEAHRFAISFHRQRRGKAMVRV